MRKILFVLVFLQLALLSCDNINNDTGKSNLVKVSLCIDNLIHIDEDTLSYTKTRSSITDDGFIYYIAISKNEAVDNSLANGCFGIFHSLNDVFVYLEDQQNYYFYATAIASKTDIDWGKNLNIEPSVVKMDQFIEGTKITALPVFADMEMERYKGEVVQTVYPECIVSIQLENYSYGIGLKVVPPNSGSYQVSCSSPQFDYIINNTTGGLDIRNIYSFPENCKTAEKEVTFLVELLNNDGNLQAQTEKKIYVRKNTCKIIKIDDGSNSVGTGISLNLDDEEMTSEDVTVKLIKPSFVFVDDDGHANVFHYTFQWAKQNNCPITIALPTKIIRNSDGRNFITVVQAQEMYNSGLVTIGSHTYNHNPNLLECEDVNYELSKSLSDLTEWGFDVNSIFYPNGAINDYVLQKTALYYKYGFLAGGSSSRPQYERVNLFINDPFQIKRMSIPCPATAQQIDNIKNAIDYAITNNGFIVFMTHIRTPKDDAEEDIGNYTDILNYIRAKGYDIEPLNVVLNRFDKKD